MSRSTSAAISITPRVPLRDRLAAIAALAQSLDLNGSPITLTGTVPVTGDLRLQVGAAIANGTSTSLISQLSPMLVSAANPMAETACALTISNGVGGVRTEHEASVALERTVNLLMAADQMVLTNALSEVMNDIGLRTTTATAEGSIAVHGQNGPQHVLALVADGTVQLDVLGCEGTTCEPTVELLLDGLTRRGFDVDELDGTTHADPEGGELINLAARTAAANSTDLVTGAVLAHSSARRSRPERDVKRSVKGTVNNRLENRHG